jgi:hypothetical protein
MDYFCYSCNLPVCKECIAQEHSNTDLHEWKHIHDVADNQVR